MRGRLLSFVPLMVSGGACSLSATLRVWKSQLVGAGHSWNLLDENYNEALILRLMQGHHAEFKDAKFKVNISMLKAQLDTSQQTVVAPAGCDSPEVISCHFDSPQQLFQHLRGKKGSERKLVLEIDDQSNAL